MTEHLYCSHCPIYQKWCYKSLWSVLILYRLGALHKTCRRRL